MKDFLSRTLSKLLASRFLNDAEDKDLKRNFAAPIILLLVIGIPAILLTVAYMRGGVFAIFDPKGLIGKEQRDLMVLAGYLMLIIVIPVFALFVGITMRYRAGNTKADYAPEWDNNHTAEAVWWGLPIILIGVLSVIIWKSTHKLEPSKAIASDVPPVTIEVVALQWKWLFIYPQQGIATVNYLKIPQGTPVKFQITADAPMNSFWIPQLGGQIYAMQGMSSQLNLIADEQGTFRGVSANLSGAGFADMHFDTLSVSKDDFDAWVKAEKQSSARLDNDAYNALAAPGTSVATADYILAQKDLYTDVVTKYMGPGHSSLSE